MRENRLDQIEQFVIANETAELEEIATKFKISMSTVRRDINKLLNNGRIYKVYGGVMSKHQNTLAPYIQRKEKNYEEKEAIAREAAKSVGNNDVIFIDSGSTTYRVLKHIDADIQVTVITASIGAVIEAANYHNIRLIVLPGELKRDTDSFRGPETINYLKGYNINKSFIAAVGISPEGEVSNSLGLEAEIKKAAMEKSKVNYLLTDHKKFKKVSLLFFANISDFDKVYIGSRVKSDFDELFKNIDTKIEKVKW